MSPADILAQSIRRAKAARDIPISIPIKQQEPLSVPVEVVEKPVPVMIEVQEPEPAPPKFPTIRSVMEAVAAHYQVTLADMVSPRRFKPICTARHVAMYLSRILTPRSFPEIGRLMGGRDHTTTLHGYRKISAEIETNHDLREDIELIKQKLVSGPAVSVKTGEPPEANAPILGS